MTTASATELKGRLGEFLEMARQEPVAIQKGGRDYAVIIGAEHYKMLEALEDAYWSVLAKEADASGYMTHEETMAFLRSRLIAK